MRYVIANWKLNKNLKESIVWTKELQALIKDQQLKPTVLVAPSFTLLGVLQENGDLYQTCAQTVSSFINGAHTGQTSVLQIKDFCKFVLVGHSETGDLINDTKTKMDIALEHGLTPIVCAKTLEDLETLYNNKAIMIWEDVENISKSGVYNPKSSQDIANGIKNIKTKLPKNAIVLYGGSVNELNCQELGQIDELDGVIVGNASLDASKFYKIIQSFN